MHELLLTLGAQVLIGFHYHAAFMPRFERLPPGLGVQATSMSWLTES